MARPLCTRLYGERYRYLQWNRDDKYRRAVVACIQGTLVAMGIADAFNNGEAKPWAIGPCDTCFFKALKYICSAFGGNTCAFVANSESGLFGAKDCTTVVLWRDHCVRDYTESGIGICNGIVTTNTVERLLLVSKAHL